MSCGFRWEVQVCGVRSRNFSRWLVYTVMYTRLVDRAKLVVRPVSMLEARPTRVSCAALFLILVRTNWNGLSASRGSYGCSIHCAYALFSFISGTMNCALHERGSLSWQNLLRQADYSSGRRRGWCAMSVWLTRSSSTSLPL